MYAQKRSGKIGKKLLSVIRTRVLEWEGDFFFQTLLYPVIFLFFNHVPVLNEYKEKEFGTVQVYVEVQRRGVELEGCVECTWAGKEDGPDG